MGQDQSASAEDERWRSKYYATLEELETKGAEWSQIEEMLRQAITRLALVADPANPTLEQVLAPLREALRRGERSSSLTPLFQNLADELTEHNQRLLRRRHSPTASMMGHLIGALPLPGELIPRVRGLQKRLEGGLDDSELVAEVTALLGDALTQPVAPVPPSTAETAAPVRSGGLLARLFGGNGQGVAPPAPLAETELAATELPDDEVDRGEGIGLSLAQDLLHLLIIDLLPARPKERRQLEDRLDVAANPEAVRAVAIDLVKLLRPDPATLPPAPNELLLQLLERLAVPEEMQGQLEQVKAGLTPAINESVGCITRALGTVADLITEMRARVQREKEELEKFLKQLTGNLQQLDHNLRSSAAQQREAWQEGQALEQAVQEQMQGLESSVQSAHDIDTLKQAVRQHVEQLQRQVESFRRSEEERIMRAEAESKRLVERIKEMEREAGELRNRVQRERNAAIVDPLTGLFNRLAYNERIADEFARWKRYGDPLVFSVWDVDRFKRINDTYGHQAGDKVLRVIAKVLRSQTRETDFLARYGGEEFILILPKTQLHQAQHVVEKLRLAVESCDFHHRDRPVRITISCGMTAFRDGDDPDIAFARADEALYQAKEQGRNRCVIKE